MDARGVENGLGTITRPRRLGFLDVSLSKHLGQEQMVGDCPHQEQDAEI